MRRIPVNLASEPVEAVRRARRIVAVAAAVLVALTVVHAAVLWWVADTAGEQQAAARGPAVPIETMRGWTDEVRELSAVADVQRAREAAAAVELGNQLLAWHAIPWSSIFGDLEGLLPDRVRLESVQPAVESGDVVRVSMTAAAGDTGPLQNLLIALETSPRFDEVLPQREDAGEDGLLRMQLWARYVPEETAAVPTTGAAEEPTTGGAEEPAAGDEQRPPSSPRKRPKAPGAGPRSTKPGGGPSTEVSR